MEKKEESVDKKEEKEEVKKPLVKVDFVPDEHFSWDFDLEKTKKGKKKKTANVPVVIRSEPAKTEMAETVKMKIRDNIEFSMTHIDKLNKGMTNTTNCCFMNVCLQSLLSSPPFFNMLLAIDNNPDIQLTEDGLLAKFVEIARYFKPGMGQMGEGYGVKVVDGEEVFAKIVEEFNPFHLHQDCHEFLAMLLDRLHDELALISSPPK